MIEAHGMFNTGYHATGIICDVCQEPLLGFSFRCLNEKCTNSASMVYDLCLKDYCGDQHLLKDHHFKRIIPTEFEADNDW